MLHSLALGLPSALIATGISDSTAVSNLFRYAISHGTALAVRIVHVEPRHQGLGVFLDAVKWYGKSMSFALMVNAILYSLFAFGIITSISALSEKRPER
jgi:hypothetical protein